MILKVGNMRSFFAASTLALLAGVAVARAELVNENLLVEVPPGYKIDFSKRNPAA
jgi:hypothetical protein